MSRHSLIAALVLAVGTVLAACSGQTAPALSDPKAILSGALDAIGQAKSVHVSAEVAGSLAAGLGGQAAGGPLDLEGTTAEADVDLAAGNLHGSFAAPALPGLNGELIAVDRVTYLKVSLLGSTYRKLAGGDGGLLGALADPRRAISGLRQTLDGLPSQPLKAPDEKCGDADCYRVTIPAPMTELGAVLGDGLGSALGSLTPDGAGGGTIDVWVRTNDLRPARLVVTADGGSQGTLTVTVQLTRWDAPVSISAPPADQVDEGAPPGLTP